MQDDTATTGTLATALTHGRRLLGQDPTLAEAQAREIEHTVEEFLEGLRDRDGDDRPSTS